MATISVQTKKFADLEAILSVTGTEQMLIHDGNGVKVITVENLHKGLQDDTDSVRNVLADGAAAHNCIYRGKNLGTSVTAEQYAAISSGKFTDLYIGDYWVINGVTYRIAAFDYYYNCGDTNFTKHHVVIVPDTSLYKAQMNTVMLPLVVTLVLPCINRIWRRLRLLSRRRLVPLMFLQRENFWSML